MRNLKLTNIIIIIVSVISLLPIFHLALYSRPCADDYSYSSTTHKVVLNDKTDVLGLIKEAIKTDLRFYKNWQGLYTSAFILSLQPSIFGENYYFIGSWLLILFMFGCIYYFVKTLLNELLHINKNVFTISIALLAIIISRLPSIIEGLYWFNGAWNYMPFMFLILLNISVLIKYYYHSDKNYLIISILLSFIISGGNHVTSFLNILLLLIYVVVSFKKDKKSILPLIFTIIGFIIMYIAPGTSIRQARLMSQPVLLTMIMSIDALSIYIFTEWNICQWILILVSSILLGIYIKEKVDIKWKDMKVNPLVLLVIALIILCGMFCVPYKAMGTFGTGRLTNVIWITFILLSIIISVYSTLWVLLKLDINIEFNNMYKIFLVLLLVNIIILNDSNYYNARTQLKDGRAELFAHQNDIRYEEMKKTNEKIIYVDEISSNSMLKFDDVTSDLDDWKNKAWKSYYGKDIVVKSKG